MITGEQIGLVSIDFVVVVVSLFVCLFVCSISQQSEANQNRVHAFRDALLLLGS